MKREIRLREFHPMSKGTRRPEEWQIKDSDGSLADKDYMLEADADGFLRSSLPQGEMNEQIIVLGDSVVECAFVDHGQRLTDQAEMVLNNAGLSVSVRNGGVSGATSLHILNSIINKIVPMRPKLLIVATGVLDQNCMLQPDSFWMKVPYYTPVITDPVQEYTEVPDTPDLDLSDRHKILRLIKATCHIFSIPLVLATLPHRGHDAYTMERMAWFPEKQNRRKRVNAQTREFALMANLPLIDMEMQFAGAADIFYDQFHFNSKGAEVVGQYLANEIRRIAYPAEPAGAIMNKIKQSLRLDPQPKSTISH